MNLNFLGATAAWVTAATAVACLTACTGGIAFLDSEELRLNGMLRQVALAADDGYIDTYASSQGHGACAPAASRWIEPLLSNALAAPLHPNAVGERGMAEVIIGDVKAAV